MPEVYPPYIFGMHDRGGEHLMLEKGKRGWVLVTEALGADPNNYGGSNYTDLTNKGLGVIVRLNHGYGATGTIPYSDQYDNFARRCGNFVQASPGCNTWIIGNEMNLAWERPGGPNGQVITPELYASCFAKCRNEIRRRPGHTNDQVIPGAPAPWNNQTTYPGNPNGDWVRYFADILNLLGQSADAIALHTYTHGQDPGFVFSESKMSPPFQDYHWHFRAYRDFMAAIPAALRNRPVYITETDQNIAWRDANSGWVRNAFQEINSWNLNRDNQPIQALILFRWIIGNPNDPQQVGWAIENKPGVQADFRDAMNNEYRVILPSTTPEYLVTWLQVDAPGVMQRGETVRFRVTMRNDGRRTWANTGVEAVRLGYRWIDAGGQALEGTRANLPWPVAAGQTVALPAVAVQAPDRPGYYTLELDLVEGADGWFEEKGSPVWKATDIRVGPRYRVAWLSVAAPPEGMAGETVTFPARLRNEGALTWVPTGENPFSLTYKWLDADRNVVVADGLRTPLGREVEPLEEIALNARVQFPAEAGTYILQMDMVHEFVVWFQWRGSPVYEVPMTVEAVVEEYAAEWLEHIAPERLVAGEAGSAYVEVKNVGTVPWPSSGDEAIRLGYRWLDPAGQEVPNEPNGGETWPLPRTIEPGQVVTFRELVFTAPQMLGTYRLVWDLLQGGIWLSSQGVAVAEQPVQIVAPEYGVEWQVLKPWPTWLPPGQAHTTSLRLHNVGTRLWSAGGDQPVHLAYNWFNVEGKISEPWDTFRIRLPQDVASGATVDLIDIPFKTPEVLGTYTLRWDLVEEGNTWFFREGGAPLEVQVEISDRALSIPWTAEASHNDPEVTLAFDGNPDTVWDSQSVQEPGMWFRIDLGRVLTLDRVRVSSPGRGFPLGYRIALSEDGATWQVVAERPKNWTNIDEAFAPRAARYLRLEQTGKPSWPATWMISEIAISSTTPWEGAEASHYAGDAHQAFDADLQTAWNTRAVKQKPGMWFELDMGSLRRIERVALSSPTNQFPRGYAVEISIDGENWQEVARKNDNWGAVDAEFQAATARHIRVQTTNSSPYYPWGISEFVVWRASPTWLRGQG